MIINDVYEFSIKIDGNEIDFDPKSFSFSLHDSIHSFYSTAIIEIEDTTGMFKESLLSCEGNIYETFLYSKMHEQIKLKSKFVIVSDESPRNLLFGVLSNSVVVNLIDAFYDTQVVENKAHKGTLSTITKKCTSDYFKDNLNIDEVDCNSTWYQIECDSKTFLETMVLPNAFSKSNAKFPFFMYTTCDGKFNFKNIKKLFEAGPVAKLIYRPSDTPSFNELSILDIKQFKSGSSNSKKFRSREIATRDLKNGNFKIEKSDIKKNLIEGTAVPIIGKLATITDFKYYGLTFTAVGEGEALKGRIVQSTKNEFFIDRYVVTTPMNTLLLSGKVVELDLCIPSASNSIESALYQSGNYLIEDCVHGWDHKTQSAITTMIVGRKSCKIPSTKLSGKLI